MKEGDVLFHRKCQRYGIIEEFAFSSMFQYRFVKSPDRVNVIWEGVKETWDLVDVIPCYDNLPQSEDGSLFITQQGLFFENQQIKLGSLYYLIKAIEYRPISGDYKLILERKTIECLS